MRRALILALALVASACASASGTELAASSDVVVAVDGSEISLAPSDQPRLLWFWGPF